MTTQKARTERKQQATTISNGIGSMHREHYGRGADRIRTVIHPGLVATTLEDCYTTVERRMIAEGAFVQVRATRTIFQDWMGPRFIEIVETTTGQKVKAFFSQVAHDPDVAIELFLLYALPEGTDGSSPER